MLATKTNPYLEGNFAPVNHEIWTEELPVIGELPLELNGLLVRNGPNPRFAPMGRHRWFDGDGMLHGIQFHQGKAAYRNRFVRTRALQMEEQAGHPLWPGILEPPPLTHPENNLFSPYKNSANTAVVWHGDRLLALWEGAEPYEIAPTNLATVGPYSYHQQLTSPMTAHPKVDPVTGEMMFFGYSPLHPPYLTYGVVSAAGDIKQSEPIDLPRGIMMHDFAITAHYTVFLDLPLTFSVKRLRRREPGWLFEPELPSRIGIVPRHGDNASLRWFEIATGYVVHVLNAYEEGEEVVVRACRATDAKGLDMPTKHNGALPAADRDRPRLHQWRCHLRLGTVREVPIDDRAIEFPSLNPQRVGYPNRYGYAATMVNGQHPLFVFDGLLKYDLLNDRTEHHTWGPNRYGGEAVFVPRPGAIVEDNGWLMAWVHDELYQVSELVVVDAHQFSGPAIARVRLPQRVPYGFHGTWVPHSNFVNHYGN